MVFPLDKLQTWIKGDYSLPFTYWVTGVIPLGLLQVLIFIAVLYGGSDKDVDNNMFILASICLVITVIYTPFLLFAIGLSAVKYKGLLLWKILTFVVLIKAILAYFQLLQAALILFHLA